MASVEMIDRDPVESGSEVVRHLAHDIAGEGAQIGKPVAVLGRHIETELMAVLPPALHKLPPIDRVGLWPIHPPCTVLMRFRECMPRVARSEA
jgi:hypothetical protein